MALNHKPQLQNYYHYLSLAGILLIGTLLRVGNLGLKPLWMDEVITGIFSLGKSYDNLPLDIILNWNQIQEIFRYQPITCSQVAENLINQSTHPPLFFCAMHVWMGWLQNLDINWIFGLRLLPAIFGVGAIALIYFLARISFSPATGLLAAACMAVSPFAVYLSQEARHYTLPIVIIILALMACACIQADAVERNRVRWWLWCGWVGINSLSIYIHYFLLLAIAAQIFSFCGFAWLYRQHIRRIRGFLTGLCLTVFSLAFTYLPWLQIVLVHSRASATDWLPKPQHIAPIYQTLINWVLMLVAFPVEGQPLPIIIFSAGVMVIFALWFGRFFWGQLRALINTPPTNIRIYPYISITAFLILEIFAIAYLFQKDITSVPRYSFLWYPSTCVLIAVSLANLRSLRSWVISRNQLIATVLIMSLGLISSIFVSYNLVFQKPFLPEKTANNLLLEPEKSTLIVMAYRNYQDIALGLSFAFAIPKNQQNHVRFAFFKQSSNFDLFWQNLAQLEIIKSTNLNLWVFAPARKRHDYPATIPANYGDELEQEKARDGQSPVYNHRIFFCQIDSRQHHRIGIPYQLYRC